MGTTITIATGDGETRGYLATPARGSGPGVLVCHAWWGMTDFFTNLCDRLASEGFVALVADAYDGATATTIEEADALVSSLTRAHARAVSEAALDTLLRSPATAGNQAGVVGFSMGGNLALALSAWRPEEVAAVVTFYGTSDADVAGARAAYLGHFAEKDEWEPDEEIEALERRLRDAGKETTFHRYPGAGHWFFESDRPDAFDAAAAGLAWERTLAFLRARLGAR